MMTPETVFAALNQASRAYSRIEHINFFGGEPTLNPEIIKIACDYTMFLFRNGSLTHLPSFVLQPTATLSTKQHSASFRTTSLA